MIETFKTKDNDEDVLRYVCSEMSAAEEARFESQLANDQERREQVAAMVCTLSAVDRVFAESSATPVVSSKTLVGSSTASARSAKRSVVKVVASLAAMILLAALAISMIANPMIANPVSSESELIAIAWAESLDADEFEVSEHLEEFELVPVNFESESEWIDDVVAATHEEAAI